jgi:hypothetical protein
MRSLLDDGVARFQRSWASVLDILEHKLGATNLHPHARS